MKLDEYQVRAGETQVPGAYSLEYLLHGLVSEVGELCALRKREIRDGKKADDESWCDELGDVEWYLSRLEQRLGFSKQHVCTKNLAKLRDRKDRGVIHGTGGDR